ncbi:unnamed protein product [Chrysoparadoxa australica]
MDIKAEKLSLIEWLVGIDDDRVIRQFKILQKSNQERINTKLSNGEKSAIDQGLISISEGKVHTHKSVIESTKKKYPDLFK